MRRAPVRRDRTVACAPLGAHRRHVRSAIAADRRDAPERLAFQVLDLVLGERAARPELCLIQAADLARPARSIVR